MGIALIVLGFLFAGAGGAGAYFAPVVAAAFQATSQHVDVHPPKPSAKPSQPAPGTPAATPAPGSAGAFTVLLLGSDNDGKEEWGNGQYLTQSMILARVDPAHQTVAMVSIPRDFYLPLYSNGHPAGQGKIMEAFSIGGAEAAEETVETNFNVKIDNYVWIGLAGLIKLIDMVGGVDVVPTNPVMDDYYPADVGTENPYGYHRVAVMPGSQHMNGSQAMEYVRSRHSDPNGDLGRSERQQQVLVALKEKAKDLNPADLPDLTATFKGELSTDIDIGRVRQLLPVASHISNGNITQVVLNGYATDSTIETAQGSEDILIPDIGAVQEKMHQYFPTAT